MSHSIERIELAVREFLTTSLKGMSPTDLDKNTSLIASGVIDSFEIVSIISHLETTYGVELDGDDMNEENFSTTESIAELVFGKLNNAA